jgi:hypothetical protein
MIERDEQEVEKLRSSEVKKKVRRQLGETLNHDLKIGTPTMESIVKRCDLLNSQPATLNSQRESTAFLSELRTPNSELVFRK